MRVFPFFQPVVRHVRSASPAVALLLAAASAHAHGGVLTSGSPSHMVTFGTLTPSAAGQVIVDSRDREWNLLNYGTPSIGGSLGAEGSAVRSYVAFPDGSVSSSNYRSSAALFTDVTLFGNVRQLASLDVRARNEPYSLGIAGAAAIPGYQPSTSLLLRLVGNTVWNQSVASTTLSKSWDIDLGPYDVSFSKSFVIGFATLSVVAEASTSAEVGIDVAADLAAVSLDFEGEAHAAAHGSAAATANVLGAKARVTGALTLGDPQLEVEVHAGLFSGLSGQFGVCVPAISLYLQLYGELRVFRKIIAQKTWTLVNWYRPQSCVSYSL